MRVLRSIRAGCPRVMKSHIQSVVQLRDPQPPTVLWQKFLRCPKKSDSYTFEVRCRLILSPPMIVKRARAPPKLVILYYKYDNDTFDLYITSSNLSSSQVKTTNSTINSSWNSSFSSLPWLHQCRPLPDNWAMSRINVYNLILPSGLIIVAWFKKPCAKSIACQFGDARWQCTACNKLSGNFKPHTSQRPCSRNKTTDATDWTTTTIRFTFTVLSFCQ